MHRIRGTSAWFTMFLRLMLLVNVIMFALGVLRRMSSPVDPHNDDAATSVGCRSNSTTSSSVGNITINSTTLVPNIVHYIWFTTEPRPLYWHHMLCIYSAHKMLRPDVIYFHTNMEPTGPYWQRILQLSTVRVKRRQPPTSLFGERIKEPIYYTSHSNVDRVKILMEYGGIYLDLDMLVLKPFDDLRRKYECTIGREIETKVCGSVIICSRHSLFLTLWINSYLDDYRVDEWAYNTGKVPFNLARRYPHLVHVDEDRFNRPNFEELDLIWSKTKRFNWRRNYGVHLYYRLWKDQSPFYEGVEPNDDNVKTWNASFGEMARTVLYGSPQVVHTDVL